MRTAPRLLASGRRAVFLFAGGLGLVGISSHSAYAEATLAKEAFATTVYNVYSGLPTNSAQVVHQTADGYIWVGTELGLSRFDGVRFETYRTTTTPELPANLIRHLHQSRSGWLWISTQGGLCRYRDGRFERMALPEGAVCAVGEDSSGGIWIGTNKGLWEYRNEKLTSHAQAPGLPPNCAVSFLFVDTLDRVWVGETGSPTYLYAAGKAQPLAKAGTPFQQVQRALQVAPDTFFVDTEKGFFRVRGDEVRAYGREQGLGGAPATHLSQDQEGRIFLAANALYMLEHADTDRFVRIPVPGVENCRSVFQDREGSYWIGTAGDGIARIRRSGFRMATPESGLLGGNVRTVAVAPDGTVWAGLAGTGVARIHTDGTIASIDTGAGSAGEVWSILPAKDGRVWIGTRAMLRVWTDGRQEEFPQYERIRALHQDRQGTIWIGSENAGILQYRDGIFTSLVDQIQALQSGPRGRNPPIPMVFAEDAHGTVYIGLRGNGGLVKSKGGVFTLYPPSDEVPTADLRAIYPDREGNLWVGTRGRGLAVFSQGKWLNPEALSEPFNHFVSALMEDDEGRLWLGTPKGIVWAPKSQLLAVARGQLSTAKTRLAMASDGVRPGIVGAGSFPNSARGPDGTLWFGTRQGLAVVEPRNLFFNKVVPPVHIERVHIDGQVAPGAGTIQLPAGSRSLEIEYTALSFSGPSQVLFRYRLEGRDAHWIEAGPRRSALYADLQPGTYRFRVAACNEDGVWNETGAAIQIVQLPFFYQTRWFYGVVALGLACSGFGVFRWRTAALEHRNTELERRIAQRTAELARSYEAIRSSEYFYQSLVESLPQIIVRKDTAGRITYANSGFGELLGRPLEEIIGRLEADFYPPEKAQQFLEDDRRAMETHQTLEYETLDEREGQGRRFLHIKKVPLYGQDGRAIGVQILFWDITSFRETEEKLKQAQRELVETSRLAGIAEMATGILHNLGNALNSVNTTTSSTVSRIRQSKVSSLGKAARLLTENSERLPEFFSSDPRGKQLPVYLHQLASHLETERDEILAELRALQTNVDHIKELVASQQQHARVAGVTETVPASELVEYALHIAEASLKRHHIVVNRGFEAAPPVRVERHKALQVIGNLLANARDALDEAAPPEKRIDIGVRSAGAGRVQIYVADNGTGIAPENLTRIFAFGFTTKKTGHGFGLHSSALAAGEMNGSLRAVSEGLGKGATFIFELPATD